MNVNVSMKKIVGVLVFVAIVCGGVWCGMETAPQRKTKAEIKVLVDFAQRQALEIAIIEQTSKLAGYRKQLAALRKPKPSVMNPFAPVPINPVPIVPDPKDVEVKDVQQD